jgi:RNA polymerase sigma-70 factor (ECF subfamily)
MPSRFTDDSPREAHLTVPVQAAKRTAARDFERVYAVHYRDVYRYLLGLTGSVDDADEIASETFERALRAWDDVPEAPLPWLLLAARRVATDRWRRARRVAQFTFRTRAEAQADAGERQAEFWLWFRALAVVLTDRQREVLVLRYQRDLTDADIGSIMGISESGVRSLVARALVVLRSHPELLA